MTATPCRCPDCERAQVRVRVARYRRSHPERAAASRIASYANSAAARLGLTARVKGADVLALWGVPDEEDKAP